MNATQKDRMLHIIVRGAGSQECWYSFDDDGRDTRSVLGDLLKADDPEEFDKVVDKGFCDDDLFTIATKRIGVLGTLKKAYGLTYEQLLALEKVGSAHEKLSDRRLALLHVVSNWPTA